MCFMVSECMQQVMYMSALGFDHWIRLLIEIVPDTAPRLQKTAQYLSFRLHIQDKHTGATIISIM